MKIYIEARPIDSKLSIIQVEVGSILEGTTKAISETDALASVKKLAPMDSKTLKPIPVKYYKHICYHDTGNQPCILEEI